MNVEVSLHHFLIDASISEYDGTINCLIGMIYWVTGEVLTIDCLINFISRNRHLGKYSINLRKDGQIKIQINE